MAQLESEFGARGWSGQIQPALVAFVICLIFLEACLWVRNVARKRRLPGPIPWPVVGNAMQLGHMPHIAFTKLAKKYGNVYQIRLGNSDIVVLNGNKAIREALVEHSSEFAGRPNFESFQWVSGGKSLTFTNYSKEWKVHRKIAQSTLRAFSSANSETKEAFEQHIVAEAKDLVKVIVDLSTQNGYFHPVHPLTVAAANIICALCFGKRYGHDDVEFRTLLQRMDKFGEAVAAGSLVDVMPWLQSFPNPVHTVYNNFKELNRDYFQFIRSKVDEHRETFDPQVTRGMSDAVIGVIDMDSDMVLAKSFTEATVADLIGAGLDTVSTGLHWSVLLLAKHRDIQSRLQRVIDQVVGRDRLPCVEDRAQLPYLDAFIYETMRFISFVPVTIPHATTSDVTIEGFHIPKDTVVFINQWSINHDPLSWKDPQVFDPSRFLDKNGSLDKDATNNVMLFSAGKRRCIGELVAKVELFLFLAILLHQCSFEKSPDENLSLNYTYGLGLKPLDYKIIAKYRR